MDYVHVEADVDLGVASRLLDLLVARDRFPSRMQLDRRNHRLKFRLFFDENGGERDVKLLAKIRQIPGVKNASPVNGVSP